MCQNGHHSLRPRTNAIPSSPPPESRHNLSLLQSLRCPSLPHFWSLAKLDLRVSSVLTPQCYIAQVVLNFNGWAFRQPKLPFHILTDTPKWRAVCQIQTLMHQLRKMNVSSSHAVALLASRLLCSAALPFLSMLQFRDNYLNILLYLQWFFYKTNVKWKMKMPILVIKNKELRPDSVKAKMEIIRHAECQE